MKDEFKGDIRFTVGGNSLDICLLAVTGQKRSRHSQNSGKIEVKVFPWFSSERCFKKAIRFYYYYCYCYCYCYYCYYYYYYYYYCFY